ncbi:MAG: FUSC family protein [Thermoleophilaceae bacterium]|nr:FUSC family protein [Thermoleophilaceae bacterium]
MAGSSRQALIRDPWLRLRVRAWPILQTAAAAVASWYLARLLLSEQQPVFASIAAVIALGATYGQRSERAIELIGGVVVGIGVADLLVRAIGSGPAQIGLMVLLAMSAAVILGGGPLLVTEAAVSAILLVVLEPTSAGLAGSRVVEALVGGGVALAVSALAFPPDPAIVVARSAQGIFGGLGRTLEELAAALTDRDTARAQAALQAAREMDGDVRGLDEAIALGRETARFTLGRRSSRAELYRYERGARQIDFAVRNTRVLARHVVRFLRNGRAAPPELAAAMHDLSLAVWALAAELDDTARGGREVRRHASRAAGRAIESFESDRDLGLAEIVAGIRSTAIDLVRAAEAGASSGEPHVETPTEELLIELPASQVTAQSPA